MPLKPLNGLGDLLVDWIEEDPRRRNAQIIADNLHCNVKAIYDWVKKPAPLRFKGDTKTISIPKLANVLARTSSELLDAAEKARKVC